MFITLITIVHVHALIYCVYNFLRLAMGMLVNCIACAVLLSSACALNGNETAVRRVLHVYSVPGYDVGEVATAVEQTINSSDSRRYNLTVEEVEDVGVSIVSHTGRKMKLPICPVCP